MHQAEKDLKTLIDHSFQRRFSFVSPEEMWHPPMDVYETDAGITVRMDLPGLDIKDLQIILEHGRLVVQGVRKDPGGEAKISYHRMEINYGAFRRMIMLPAPVKATGTKANYKDGFLEIKLPFSGPSRGE